MNARQSLVIASSVSSVLLVGCSGTVGGWHDRAGLDAENVFDDPQVVALCESIEANDLEEMDRLIAAGANVNAVGKGGVTPLLWAFPEDKIERFEKLLKHGANPNVHLTDGDLVDHAFPKGLTVTHLAFKSSFERHWRVVLQHGGDPNVRAQGGTNANSTPLHVAIRGQGADKLERVQALVKAGADIGARRAGYPPAIIAMNHLGHYDLARELVELGAGIDETVHIYDSGIGLQTLAHFVVWKLEMDPPISDAERRELLSFRDFLVERGADMDAARQDRRRWSNIPGDPAIRKRVLLDEARARVRSRGSRLQQECTSSEDLR